MDMGKAIILKKKDGEKVYPISASDLIFDPETKKNVKKELAEKIGDAPSDGKQYARINGGWAEVESNGGEEILSISLKTNQESHEDLLGAIVTISFGEDIANYTWEGENIIVGIPKGTIYNVLVSDVNGYKTPKEKGYIAVSGYSRYIEFVYQTELATINVDSYGGDVEGYEVKVMKPVTVEGVPQEYTPVEYIQCNGAQYIDTKFIANTNTRVVIDFEATKVTSDLSCIFGLSSSGAVFSLYYNTNKRFDFRAGSSSTVSPIMDILNKRYVLDATTTQLIIGNEAPVYISASEIYNTSITLKLLAINNGSNMPYGKVYSCKIYDGETLARDYVPVVNAEGVAGLYDKVNNLFYASSSSTQFVAGPRLGELIAKQTIATGTYKIPFGTEYFVTANDVTGYSTPVDQLFTASQVSREVLINYRFNTKGVYIQDVDNKLYTSDEWDNSKTPNGIAVLSDGCEFVLALTESEKTLSLYSVYELFDGVFTATSKSVAKTDFNGELNTSKIDSANSESVKYCKEFIFPNGNIGYLGSAGEWMALNNNLTAINALLSKCGGTNVVTNTSLGTSSYWTSTQYNNEYSWITIPANAEFYDANKMSKFSVRAFAKY